MAKSTTQPAADKASATRAPAAAKTAGTDKVVKSSRIDLASNTKTKVIGILNERLADGIDLPC